MTASAHRSLRGFTLIELLIVIAIILILIAIALPNFLEAQIRAKVTRAAGNLRSVQTASMTHLTDFGFLYSDFNASGTAKFKTRQKSNTGICLPNAGLVTGSADGGLTFLVDRRTYYSNNVHCPLTTPIKYIEALELIDPFSDGTVPIGYDSYEDENFGKFPPDTISYCGYFSSGPDHEAGSWAARIPYSPTNGSKSSGELWRIVEFLPQAARTYFGGSAPYPSLQAP